MLGRLVTLECQLVDLPADHQPPASISASRVQISPLKVPSHCEACQNGLDGRGNDLPVLATFAFEGISHPSRQDGCIPLRSLCSMCFVLFSIQPVCTLAVSRQLNLDRLSSSFS